MLLDSCGRKIDYLRISVTDKCNLRCRYCMPVDGIINRPRHELLSFEEIATFAKAAARSGVENIRLTGGEPLIRKDLHRLVKYLNEINGIRDISLTTNGIFLKEHALGLKRAGLKRLNISLDSLDHDRYSEITRGGDLKAVLEGIEEARDIGYSLIKINVLLLDEMTRHEIPDFLRLTLENNLHVRFLEFMPIGGFYKTANVITGKEVLAAAARYGDIEEADVYGNGPAKSYRLKNSLGTFGIIAPLTDKFCISCNRLRLTSDGFLKSCLYSDIKVNVRDSLRRGASIDELEELIRSAVYMKPKEHTMDKEIDKPLEYSMCQIGG